jgi:hypothetical protein
MVWSGESKGRLWVTAQKDYKDELLRSSHGCVDSGAMFLRLTDAPCCPALVGTTTSDRHILHSKSLDISVGRRGVFRRDTSIELLSTPMSFSVSSNRSA